MQKFSQIDWRLRLFQLTIILIPFSYQPRIYLSSLQGLNLEFSLVQISASLFVAICLPLIFKQAKNLADSLPLRFLAIFVGFNFLSVIWSADVARTLVLSVYWGFLFLLVLSIASLFMNQKIERKNISNPLLIGAVIGAGFGWFQFIGEMFDLSPTITLIREAYNADLFGFARIHSLTLEPQFYASTLIAPIIYLTWKILNEGREKIDVSLLVFFLITIAFTVSRGGILALTIGLVVLILLHISFKDNKLNLSDLKYIKIPIAVIICGFFCLYLIAVSQINNSFTVSFEKYIDQISLGLVDINIANDGAGVDGLVEISTSSRVEMVKEALEITQTSFLNFIVGVGAGSFGPVFSAQNQGVGNEIVNNQYIEILVELGIIGLSLFLAFLVSFGKDVWRKTKPYNALLTSLLAAYIVQYLFFSLQTNIIHVWIYVGVAMGLVLTHSQNRSKKND